MLLVMFYLTVEVGVDRIAELWSDACMCPLQANDLYMTAEAVKHKIL